MRGLSFYSLILQIRFIPANSLSESLFQHAASYVYRLVVQYFLAKHTQFNYSSWLD